MGGTPATLFAVALYIACTLPCMGLLLQVHGWRSAYTNGLQAGLVLQVIPIGLIFFPLGLLGVAVLCATTVGARWRLLRLRESNLGNELVLRHWTREYRANLWALSLAIQQKAIAILFLHVSTPHAGGWPWLAFILASATWWVVIADRLRREG